MAQPVPIQQRGHLPADAVALARTHNVGTPLAQYKSQSVSMIFWAVIIGIFGVICLLALLTGFNTTDIVIALFGIILLAYAVLRIATALNNRGARIYMCSDGLIRATKAVTEVQRWDQTSEVWKLFRRSLWSFNFYTDAAIRVGKSMNRPFYVLDAYKLRRTDGSEVTIDRAFNKFKQLGQAIELEMTNRLMPDVLARYNAGQLVSFGELAFSQQGITVPGGKVIPWPEVTNVAVMKNGFIYIYSKKQGQLLPSTDVVEMWKVPNAFVFLTLAKQNVERQKQEKKQQKR
jgi:hypothetical protein